MPRLEIERHEPALLGAGQQLLDEALIAATTPYESVLARAHPLDRKFLTRLNAIAFAKRTGKNKVPV